MLRNLVLVIVVVVALLPMAVQADTLFIPQAHNGVRNWFTTQDVASWIAETGNVMPVTCNETKPGIFTSCTVDQAQPLTLIWDNSLGKVVAQ